MAINEEQSTWLAAALWVQTPRRGVLLWAFLAQVFILQTGAGVLLCSRMASLFLLLKMNCAVANLGDPPAAVAARPGGAMVPLW